MKTIWLALGLFMALVSCTKDIEYSDMTRVVFESRFPYTIQIDVDNGASGYYVYPTDSIVSFPGRDCNGVGLLGQPYHVHKVGVVSESDKIFEGVIKPYNIIEP